ncbi:hypothetical protein BGZ54_001730 [Gamsiella multidivaricata]|nr:hypothetical protein BGZ54_001730 [Gamsiella multidivaricata]
MDQQFRQRYLVNHVLNEYEDNKPLKKSDVVANANVSSPTSKKPFNSNFLKKARQASDSALRTLNRKPSDSNLDASQKSELTASPGAYEQNSTAQRNPNPQQMSVRPVAPPRPPHPQQYLDSKVPVDWTANPQDFLSELRNPTECRSEPIQQNMSLPDMNEEYGNNNNNNNNNNNHGPAAAGPASPPGNQVLPGQATNSSRSRPRVQPHCLAGMSSEPVPTIGLDDSSIAERQWKKSQRNIKWNPGYQPQAPPRGSSRFACSPQHPVQPALPEEPSSNLAGNHIPAKSKEQSYTAPGTQHAMEGEATETGPQCAQQPTSTKLPRVKVHSGLFPQDVLRNMNPEDLKKAINASVIASRIYKVMNSEQLDSLKKEQDELEQFIESMTVSLLIETRVREASLSSIRMYASSSKMDSLKAATDQLQTATQKMD